MNQHKKEQIAFALVMHVPVRALAFHAPVLVQVEEAAK
jgi:hypothetical protein